MEKKKRKGLIVAGVILFVALIVLCLRSCGAAWRQVEEQMEQPSAVQEPAGTTLKNPGKYLNNTQLSWTTPSGKVISVGLDNGQPGDYLYLNLRCSSAQEGSEIGFYLKTDRGLLEYSDWLVGLSDCDSGTNAGETNFYIAQQMYSEVARIEYTDQGRYGVRWSDDGSDGTIAGATISARIVNLKTAEFIGICDIEISYDQAKSTYAITDIHSADVKETGLLSADDRSAAIQAAITFAEEEIFVSSSLSDGGWQQAARAGAVVHKVNHTYFARLLDTDSKADKFVNHYTCQDTYAVTMPVSYYGYVTIYCAPAMECMGLTEATLYDSDDLNLTVYGYDPLNPRDEETIIVPLYFFSM